MERLSNLFIILYHNLAFFCEQSVSFSLESDIGAEATRRNAKDRPAGFACALAQKTNNQLLSIGSFSGNLIRERITTLRPSYKQSLQFVHMRHVVSVEERQGRVYVWW